MFAGAFKPALTKFSAVKNPGTGRLNRIPPEAIIMQENLRGNARPDWLEK